ncbi:MAG TPA: glycosyl hydrolase, partial [Thermomicrobiales bacterium]|nr:glycosyl hydrolase [Thermomicrobiales bacterium]
YNQPTGEFYHVAVDNAFPYRVYGAQQDNTTMSIPSRSNYDAIIFPEWREIGGGESGYIAIHPDNPDIVFAGSMQGYLTKYDHARGQLRNITVWPESYMGWGAADMKYRFQWTSPTIISSHDHNILITGANVIFRSDNMGESWTPISGDLTRGDPETLGPSGGPITKDNTGAEVYGTVFTIAESPVQAGVFWAGSDDGLVHVSRDNGETWQSATPDTLPDWALISLIDASPHDPGTAWLAATRYKMDDFAPYLYKTTDYGQTWVKITGGIPNDDFTRVVREDPQRPGLLYAGTETGLYISFNSGDSWERLGGNFPVVPIHDLIVKGDELVVGTHGRSFWIFDDLTLLRQLRDDALKAQAHLFKPKDTVRIGRLAGFGHSPIPGKNYHFAGGFIPAFEYEKTEEGNARITFIDAGNIPPDGVMIHYTLADKPKGEITLGILNSNNGIVNIFTSKVEKEETTPHSGETADFPAALTGGDDAEDTKPHIPSKPGLNRFVWNMRAADANKVKTKGGDQPGVTGPKVAPGTYTVNLTVGDENYGESFELLVDPRVEASQEDLVAQYELGLKVRDKLSEINDAVNQLRTVREQVDGWVKRARGTDAESKLKDVAKGLKEKLDAVEGQLMQVKAKSMQDTLNYPVMLNTKLAGLGWAISGADDRPTKQAFDLYDDLAARIDAQIAELKQIMDKDVPAFNKAVLDASIPAIVA